jgi:hypothetical protein
MAMAVLSLTRLAVMTMDVGATTHFVTNVTADEWTYAAAVGTGVRVEGWDNTTFADLGSLGFKWHSITFVETVGKLFAAPVNADAVLIIDPVTNTMDVTTLAGFGSGGSKWYGIAYVEAVGKLFTAPATATAALDHHRPRHQHDRHNNSHRPRIGW